AKQKRDPKFGIGYGGEEEDGGLHPPSRTLGGCTARNPLIMVYPHKPPRGKNTPPVEDPSRNAVNKRPHYERTGKFHYHPVWRWIQKLFGWNPTRHGFAGWLTTEKSLPKSVLGDKDLIETIKRSALKIFHELRNPLQQLREGLVSKLDPNDWRIDKLAA